MLWDIGKDWTIAGTYKGYETGAFAAAAAVTSVSADHCWVWFFSDNNAGSVAGGEKPKQPGTR